MGVHASALRASGVSGCAGTGAGTGAGAGAGAAGMMVTVEGEEKNRGGL